MMKGYTRMLAVTTMIHACSDKTKNDLCRVYCILYTALHSNVSLLVLEMWSLLTVTTILRTKTSICFSFLDASTHLYKRVCPSVGGPSVVGLAFFLIAEIDKSYI